MDLDRLPNDKKLELCRWYFKVGCLFLPFVWTVNAVWFFREAFKKPPYEEQKQIRKFVIMSICGALVWLAILCTWVTVFQLYRVSWGRVGDAITYTLPLGRA